MSGPNGELRPTSDSPARLTPGKRKRANLEASNQSAAQERSRLHDTLRNLIEILNKSVSSY